jgi:murein DD-endopeptidase MepM/ murein hydrolase activator NlpD
MRWWAPVAPVWVLSAVIGAAAARLPAAAALTVTAKSRAVAPGEIVVLTIAGASTAPRARVFGRELRAFPGEGGAWTVLVGIDLDVKPGKYTVAIDAGADKVSHVLEVAAKQFRTRTLKVDEAFVNPSAASQLRIADEAKLIAAIWEESAKVPLWNGPFIRPVSEPANSAFGTRSVFNGQPRSAHGGADFLSPAGTPVKSPNGGKVLLARELYYSGNTVIVDHGMGVLSFFGHLSAMTVSRGDRVETGQAVGRVGATGRVTGPHLHWTLRVSGARVDPLALLALLGRE